MENAIIVLILAVLMVGIIWHLAASTKRGEKCIGCPYAKQCAKNSGCDQNKRGS